MNIYTVRDNLKRTIEGKEKYLAQMREDIVKYNQTVNYTVAKYLEVNLDELKKILADVEKCVEKDVEQSWRDNPDRMGGQFTQDEIDNASKW